MGIPCLVVTGGSLGSNSSSCGIERNSRWPCRKASFFPAGSPLRSLRGSEVSGSQHVTSPSWNLTTKRQQHSFREIWVDQSSVIRTRDSLLYCTEIHDGMLLTWDALPDRIAACQRSPSPACGRPGCCGGSRRSPRGCGKLTCISTAAGVKTAADQPGKRASTLPSQYLCRYPLRASRLRYPPNKD